MIFVQDRDCEGSDLERCVLSMWEVMDAGKMNDTLRLLLRGGDEFNRYYSFIIYCFNT